jgi:hypothetical protein
MRRLIVSPNPLDSKGLSAGLSIYQFPDLFVAEAIDRVVVDHPDGLHEGVADCGADEFEATAQEILAQRIGLGGATRNVPESAPAVSLRAASDESPEVGVEAAEFSLDVEKSASVPDGGGDLQTVADDAGVGKQFVNFILIVTGDGARIEAVEGRAVVFPFAQDGLPAQASLGALKDQEFKERVVVVQRYAPFVIVVGDGGLGFRPRATEGFIWSAGNQRQSFLSGQVESLFRFGVDHIRSQADQ